MISDFFLFVKRKLTSLLDINDEKIWIKEILKFNDRKNELLEIAEKYKKEKQVEQFKSIIKI